MSVKNVLLIILFSIFVGCDKKEPINLDSLQIRGEMYYNLVTKDFHTGNVVKFYSSGQPEIEGFLKNGKWEGPFKSYFKNGQIYEQGIHKNGKPHGPLKIYFRNGRLDNLITYKDGIFDGPFKFYNEYGKLVTEGEYKDGELVEVKKY